MSDDGSTEIDYVSSSFTNGTNCVEVGTDPASGHIAVRQSKDRNGPTLRFSRSEWSAFLSGVRAGEFTFDEPTE